MALFDNYKQHNKAIDNKIKEEIERLREKVHYFNKDPKDSLDEVIQIQELKEIIKDFTQIKYPKFKELLKISFPYSLIVAFVFTIITSAINFINHPGIKSFMIAVNTFILTEIFSFIICAFLVFAITSKVGYMENAKEIYPVFMKGIFPDDYYLANVKENKEFHFIISRDSNSFYKFDNLYTKSLLTFKNKQNQGYLSEITLENKHKDKKGNVTYTTVFSGFLGSIKFNQEQPYFGQSGGFVIANKGLFDFRGMKNYFNILKLNERLVIIPLNNSDDFKIKQFLTPETEELIYSLLNQFKTIGIKLTNTEITLLLDHKQDSFLGDNNFTLNDFLYKNLYVEYEKFYCLEILYNRLKRNMTGEINLEKEKEMNHWIYEIKDNVENKEWDNWIKSLGRKRE